MCRLSQPRGHMEFKFLYNFNETHLASAFGRRIFLGKNTHLLSHFVYMKINFSPVLQEQEQRTLSSDYKRKNHLLKDKLRY